ncbi:MAG: class I SAM-dependent methyltransferase [Patescibacteria group bacterium]|nr:class I SAM-dependent methyltransferase [Patescibacteria group bacterium]MDD4304236.1 class I SAM-dependent methyltransferase [Patescibacteria group bacterium]MDD4695290.1 class I SAM-dependent methyltransferase [Patescibacteria group bacterium]
MNVFCRDFRTEKLHKRRMIHGFVGIHEKVILEVGCGKGYCTEILLTEDNFLLGIDPCEEDIKEIMTRNFPRNAQFRACGLQHMTHGYSFDLIVFYKSFHELQGISLEEALIKSKHLLNPNGKILIIEESLKSQLFKIHNYDPFKERAENLEIEKVSRAQKCVMNTKYELCVLRTTIEFKNVEDFCIRELHETKPDQLFKSIVVLAIKEATSVYAGEKPFCLKEVMNMYLIS